MKTHCLTSVLGIMVALSFSHCVKEIEAPALQSVIVSDLVFQTPALGARKEYALIVETQEIYDCGNFNIEGNAVVTGATAQVIFTEISSPKVCNTREDKATGRIFLDDLYRDETHVDLILNADTTEAIIHLNDSVSIEVINQGVVRVSL